jgi:hypothetical protein
MTQEEIDNQYNFIKQISFEYACEIEFPDITLMEKTFEWLDACIETHMSKCNDE